MTIRITRAEREPDACHSHLESPADSLSGQPAGGIHSARSPSLPASGDDPQSGGPRFTRVPHRLGMTVAGLDGRGLVPTDRWCKAYMVCAKMIKRLYLVVCRSLTTDGQTRTVRADSSSESALAGLVGVDVRGVVPGPLRPTYMVQINLE